MAKVIIFGDIKTNTEIKVDPRIQDICKDADVVLANLEGPFVKKAKPRKNKKGSALSSNENIKKLINDLKISVLIFGNNHILDYGLEGLKESISLATDLGINWLGASDGEVKEKYLYIDEKNKVAILSFSHREGPFSEVGTDEVGPYALPEFSIIEAVIRDLNQKGYSVIVSYHGGEEFFTFPWPRRYAWSEQLIKAGALVVIGQHSHSVQPVLKLESGYLALGLGNTYFHTPYQESHKGTNDGILLEVDTDRKAINYYSLESNWEAASLSITSNKSLLPVTLKETEIIKNWCKEAQKKVFLNQFKYEKRNSNILITILKRIYIFLMLSKSSLTSIRDRDILIACIPFFGKHILSRNISKNPKDFKF